MKKYDDTKPAKLLINSFSKVSPGVALDMGCGKGRNALWLAQKGWVVDAVDPKSKWLDMAKQRALEQNLTGLSFNQSDIESYEATKQYDLVVCAMVLHFLPKESVLVSVEKMKPWVKIGGRIYLSVMTDQNPKSSRPTLFHKGQLKSYFDDWVIEEDPQIKSDLIMPGETKPQIQYFNCIIARRVR